MNSIHRLLARPRALLLVIAIVSALLVPLLLRLDLRGDLVDLLPRSSTAAQTFGTYSTHLSAGQELIALVTCAEPERLVDFAERYAAALRQHPEVEQVTHRIGGDSLRYLRDHLLLLLNDSDLDELSRRLEPEALRRRASELRGLLSAPGGSALAPLLTADPLELVPLLSSRLGSGLQVDARSGYLRTADGKALLIKIRPRFKPLDWQRGEQFVEDAGKLARSLGAELALTHFEDGSQPKVAFTGSYAFPPYFRHYLERDMTGSTLISVGAVLLLFALVFRTLRILPWVLVPLLLAGVWTAAVAQLLYGRINGVSMAFATILVAIGVDLPIQLYNRLCEEFARPREPGETPAAIVRRITALLAGPSLLATLGPAVVFLCCGLSDFRGLNQLGVLAGLGLLLNCVAMLTVFPALLMVLPQGLWFRAAATRAHLPRPGRRELLATLGSWLGRNPRAVLIGVVLSLAVSVPLLPRIGLVRDLLSMDLGQMPPALVQAEISRRFGEQQRFLVALIEDTDPERALHRGDQWQQAAESLRNRGLLRGYEALSTLAPSETTQAARRERLGRLDLPQAAERLRAALEEAGFDSSAFQGFLELLKRGPQSVLRTDDLAKTELGFLVRSHVADLPATQTAPARRLVAVFLFATADATLPTTLAALQAIASGPAGGSLTGLPLLETQLRELLARDLVRITAASLFAVALLLVVYYRRLRPVLAVLLPLSVAWALFGAALALFGIPLHLYNLLAVPLCIGYGIDDHVFLLHRHIATPPSERSPGFTLRTTGRAVVLTSLATMAGFLGLLVAHFPGLVQLGLCGALAVLLCLLAALFIMPPLLALWWPPQPRPADPSAPMDSPAPSPSSPSQPGS